MEAERVDWIMSREKTHMEPEKWTELAPLHGFFFTAIETLGHRFGSQNMMI